VLLQATLHRTMERDEQAQNQEQHRGGGNSLLDRLTQ
jgi:hypothetical protein